MRDVSALTLADSLDTCTDMSTTSRPHSSAAAARPATAESSRCDLDTPLQGHSSTTDQSGASSSDAYADIVFNYDSMTLHAHEQDSMTSPLRRHDSFEVLERWFEETLPQPEEMDALVAKATTATPVTSRAK